MITAAKLLSQAVLDFETKYGAIVSDPIISITLDSNEETVRIETHLTRWVAEICSDGPQELHFTCVGGIKGALYRNTSIITAISEN